MAAIGLVLLVIAALIALVTGLGNSGSDHALTNFSAFGIDIDASSGRVYIYGVAVGAVGMLGLNMFLAGIGRGMKNKIRTHQELKAERKENEHLHHELDLRQANTDRSVAEQHQHSGFSNKP